MFILHLPVSQSSNIDPHSLSYMWHWRWTSQTVLTDSKQKKHFSSPQKTQFAQKDTLSPMIPHRGQCLLTEKGEEEGERKKEPCHTFSSFLPPFSMWPFFVWLCGVMINTATHGKRLTVTMEGVVLVSRITSWPASASQAHLAGPWDPAAGIHKEKKNGYLIIIICGITQKLLAMCKQINPATLLNRARSKVLNWVWKVSHEKAFECVQRDVCTLCKVEKTMSAVRNRMTCAQPSLADSCLWYLRLQQCL